MLAYDRAGRQEKLNETNSLKTMLHDMRWEFILATPELYYG